MWNGVAKASGLRCCVLCKLRAFLMPVASAAWHAGHSKAFKCSHSK